jgi:Uma2 family endonuclease
MMLPRPMRRRVSEAQFLSGPVNERPPIEFVNGIATQKPDRLRTTWDAIRMMARRLTAWEEAQPGRYIAWSPTIDFSRGADRRYRCPDLAAWLPGDSVGDDLFLPPTLAIEIRSEGQAVADLRDKCREYRAHGVDACWLIDPYRRTVEAFEDGREGEVLLAGATLESRYVPGLQVEVASLFSGLDRPGT